MKSAAKADLKTIVLPEGEDPRTIVAATKIIEEGLAKIVILGNPDEINVPGATVIDPRNAEKHEEYAQKFAELRAKKGVTIEQARAQVMDATYFGTMMVKMGDADGLVSGACHSTADTLRTALEKVGVTVNPTLWDFYTTGAGKDYSRNTAGTVATASEVTAEVPWDVYTDEVKDSVAQYGDAAIVTLSRVGGEGADLPSGENGTNDSWIKGQEGDGNYLALSAEEKELLQNLKTLKDNGTFKKIIVLINSSNAIEMDFPEPGDLRRGLRHRFRYVDRRRGPDRHQRCGPAARRHCDPLRLSGGHLSVRQSGKPCHVQLLHPGLPQRSRVQPADQ